MAKKSRHHSWLLHYYIMNKEINEIKHAVRRVDSVILAADGNPE